MTKIKQLTDDLHEEIDGAKKYAERYVEYKLRNQSDISTMYKKMANDELDHATKLHSLIVTEIKTMEGRVEPPQWMMDKWNETHSWFIEKQTFVKSILNM